jgi:hypothetical protein
MRFMPTLLEYPRQLLTTADVLALLRKKDAKSIHFLIRESGFPKPSVAPGRHGQLWRASLVDDWIKRQERAAQG